jgi:hypothetical protein
MKDSYNGWTNYETWAVNLWMGESSDYWEELIQDVIEGEDLSDVRALTYKISLVLKEQHEDDMPQTSGVFGDLLSASLSLVNWYEIAEHIVEDALEEFNLEKED